MTDADPTPTDPTDAPEAPAVTVELRRNGPIVVTGPVQLIDGSDATTVGRLFLCRCGRSATKPTCDGTHRTNGFTADGVEPARRP